MKVRGASFKWLFESHVSDHGSPKSFILQFSVVSHSRFTHMNVHKYIISVFLHDMSPLKPAAGKICIITITKHSIKRFFLHDSFVKK